MQIYFLVFYGTLIKSAYKILYKQMVICLYLSYFICF